MARKVCIVCQHRTVGTGPGSDPDTAKGLGQCAPCYELAGWDNTHSDSSHEDPEGSHSLDLANEMDSCWVCHPELNLATDRTPRKAKAGHNSPRRTQLNHRTQCTHPQTPQARRACREAFWALEAKAGEVAKDTAATAKSKGTAKAVQALNEHMLKVTTAAKVGAKVRAAQKAK